MMPTFRYCWKENDRPSDHTSRTQIPPPRKPLTNQPKTRCRQSSDTNTGLLAQQKRGQKYRSTPMLTTTNASMAPFKPCTCQSKGTSLLLSADGSVLFTDKKAILQHWAQHFDSVINRESTINSKAIDRMPQVPINNELAAPPTESEVLTAIKHLSRGKAPGSDSIPAEIYKAGGPVMTQKLTELFISMWEQESIPQELKDATPVHLYKRKGDRQSGESPCSPLPARFLQEFSSTTSSII